MNTIHKRISLLFLLVFMISCKAPGDNENTIISIKTTLGDIKLKLYDNTPIHRDNFIKLVNTKFYEGISFHRIIKEFMIQAGDPSTNPALASLNDSLKIYTIPAEFNPLNYHKKGALAAARQGNNVNPEMRSSGTQFYIVQGKTLTDSELNQAEQRINNNIKQAVFYKYLYLVSDSVRKTGKTANDSEIQEIATVKMFEYLNSAPAYKITEDQRNVYRTLGGTPLLDGTYTVFGELIEGLEIIDRIASVATGANDKPLEEIKILKVKIVSK